MEKVFHSDATANDDEQLMVKVAQGDRAAFGLLYDHLATLLYSLALKMLADETGAREILRDVFLSVWNQASAYRPERGSVFSWTVSLVRHRAIDRLRARRRQDESTEVSGTEPELPGFGTTAPVRRDEAGERTREVRSAIGQLSEEERQVLRLAFFEGLTHVEIAEKLEEPPGTIKTCAYRGLARLRTLLRFVHE